MQSKYNICTQNIQLAIVLEVYNWMIDQISIDSKEEDKHSSNNA